MFCLSAQCRDPSPDRRLGHRASSNRTAGEVEASPDSDSAADCRAQLEERRRPVLCITATFSPSHRSCPERCITALQSSLAPTQARCCSDAHLPKKVGTKNIHLYPPRSRRARPESLTRPSTRPYQSAVASAARLAPGKGIRTAASRTRRERKKSTKHGPDPTATPKGAPLF